jgi:hypothetical protein
MGTTGSYVSAKPPRGSLASFWLPGAGNTSAIMAVTYPIGSIIDITVRLVIASGQANDTATITVAGRSVGDVIIFNLDGSTGNLLPVSYL